MTIDEALNYFRMAESEGYYAPDTTELSMMSEEEIIKAAEYLGAKGDFYANDN